MTDISTLEQMLAQNNELLCSIYAVLLFLVGVGGALLVLFLLYKFLRKFF